MDYDASIDDNSKLRSSIGLGIDWLTPIGPMNFTFSETLTKADTDITESFRFNLNILMNLSKIFIIILVFFNINIATVMKIAFYKY